MMQPVAEGWWCTTCEMFEDDDTPDVNGEMCSGCGHEGAQHLRVEVVTK